MSTPIFEGGRLRKIPGIEARIMLRLALLGFGEIARGRGRRRTPAFKAFVQHQRDKDPRLPYDERSLAKWARGVNAPEFPMAARLARDLDVPLSWLLLGPDIYDELPVLVRRKEELARSLPGVSYAADESGRAGQGDIRPAPRRVSTDRPVRRRRRASA